jgi:hypothetical protein
VTADALKTAFFFDQGDLLALAEHRADAYRSATPFPHTVIDGFLPEWVIERCAAEFPGRDDIAWALYTDRGNTLKLATEGEEEIPPFTRQLIAQLNGGPLVRFLERLTGISGLVADPHLLGGGLHRIEPGGYLNVHADFNRHPLLDLERRINLLLYLNPGWQESWEGCLELCDRSGRRQRISPIANRCVIFNTTDAALHGHPVPVACPEGEARRSIALYYYSARTPEEAQVSAHSTLYESERAPEGSPLRQAAVRWLPPAVVDVYRRRKRAHP